MFRLSQPLATTAMRSASLGQIIGQVDPAKGVPVQLIRLVGVPDLDRFVHHGDGPLPIADDQVHLPLGQEPFGQFLYLFRIGQHLCYLSQFFDVMGGRSQGLDYPGDLGHHLLKLGGFRGRDPGKVETPRFDAHVFQ